MSECCVHSVQLQCTLVAILDFDDAFRHKRYRKAAISIKRFLLLFSSSARPLLLLFTLHFIFDFLSFP